MPAVTSGSPTIANFASTFSSIDWANSASDGGTWTRWNATNGISYSFIGLNSNIAYSYPVEYSGSTDEFNSFVSVTGSQSVQAVKAFNAWNAVANTNLFQTTENNSNVGTIRVGFSDQVASAGPNLWGYAYTPFANSTKAGDIWINTTNAGTTFNPGSLDYLSLMHEIGHALGLSHPFSPEALMPLNNALDNQSYTLMSYTETSKDGAFGAIATTPMLYDIIAIQYLYGANYSTNSGDTTYTFGDGKYFETIWDGGGNDTLSYTGNGFQAILDLNPGSWSKLGAINSTQSYDNALFDNVAIAYGTWIENASGGSYSDIIYGNDLNNVLSGNGGTDVIYGGAGNDTIVDNSDRFDNDILTGGSGRDNFIFNNAEFRNNLDTITDFRVNDKISLSAGSFVPSTVQNSTFDFNSGVSIYLASRYSFNSIVNLTGLTEADLTVSDGSIVRKFDGLRYIASYADLGAAYGLNAEAAKDHFGDFGELEGRRTSFDPWTYMAANADIRAAFGSNSVGATSHYITTGRNEGRTTTFDTKAYWALNTEARYIGTDNSLLAQNYVTGGASSSYNADFDVGRYMATYVDIRNYFGTDLTGATLHFYNTGYDEGRAITYDALRYVASHSDLITAFGTNQSAATNHWSTWGQVVEGRSITFNALSYIASYADLMNAFNTNTTTATNHYITNGFSEGRSTTFSATDYLLANQDLIDAFGFNPETAARHYIGTGRFEGRKTSLNVINGTANQDNLTGTAGADKISGLASFDTIIGGFGSDWIQGGLGSDNLTGGDGSDVFYFDSPSGVFDRINDFKPGIDHLVFNSAGFGVSGGGELHPSDFASAGSSLKTGGFANSAYDNAAAGSYLYFDADGQGGSSAVLIALTIGTVLTASDIIFI